MVSAGGIKVYSFLNISRVADFSMEIKSGEHGRVTLRGYLDGSCSVGRLQDEPVQITVQEDAGSEELLFCGIIQDTHIFYENGVSQVILTALTNDIKMDREEKSRSFQNKTDTCLRIMKSVAAGTEGEVRCSRPSVRTGYPVVQYRETDWEFCRRMASNLGLAVYADPLSPHPVITAGLPEKGGGITFSANRYRACVDEVYYHFRGTGKSRQEFLYYEVESGENHEIGESAHYRGQKRYIYEKAAELEDGMLVFRYRLGGKCRFEQGKYENGKIAGVSLRGKVAKREGQTVCLELEIDGADARGKHPYPWAPATGSLMYCMPQEGTEVFLYFPDGDEGKAYAVSTVYSNASCPGFADAQKRGLVTEHGKKIELYPDRLGFLGGTEGDEKNCRLGKEAFGAGAGSGKLRITGKEKVEFRAPEIRLSAAQKIGQYTMESLAADKEGELYPRGSRNPATGGGGGAGIDMDGGSCNGLSAQGILAGTEYESYKAFEDAPSYEESSTLLKVLAGAVVAVAVGLAVGALVVATGGTAAVLLGVTAMQLGLAAGAVTAGAGIAAAVATGLSDSRNGTKSSLDTYINNAYSASTRIGGAILALTLALPAADMMTMMITGGCSLIPVGNTVVTLPQVLGAFRILTGATALLNLAVQGNELNMFCFEGKPMGAPTGNWLYDNTRDLSEMGAASNIYYGMSNPYAYSKVTTSQLPDETGIVVQGSAGVPMVPDENLSAASSPMSNPDVIVSASQPALPGSSKTKLDYVTSNGLVLEATSGKTTTVLGTYRSDTGAILDELGNVKSLDFGSRDGGFNLLNTPDELYISPDQFWNEYNKPWLSNAIERNDIFKIATEPTWDNLTRTNMYTGKIELTGFGREYTYLRKNGYLFDSVTKTMSR